jgi:hypothetical protein
MCDGDDRRSALISVERQSVSISLIGMEITMTNMSEHRADETKTKFGSKQYQALVHATVGLRRRMIECYLAFWPYLD